MVQKAKRGRVGVRKRKGGWKRKRTQEERSGLELRFRSCQPQVVN